MALFGTRGRAITYKFGVFYCPGCKTERDYEWKRVENWFIFFVPLIPRGPGGEYVECKHCTHTYETETVELYNKYKSTEKQVLAVFKRAIRDVMIMMMLADRVIDLKEKASIQKLYSKISSEDYPPEVLDSDIKRIQAKNQDINSFLTSIKGMLNPQGRALVMKSAILVAMADGIIPKEERVMLGVIAKKLEMTQKDVTNIINDAKSTKL